MLLNFDTFSAETLENLDNPVFSIAMTPDARLAVVGRARSAISVWDTQSGEMLDSSYDSRSTIAVAVTPDQRRMICRSRQGPGGAWSMQVWEIKMAIGRPFIHLSSLQQGLGPSMALAVSPDGRQAAWGKGARTRISDIETGECLEELEGSGEIQSVRFSPDGCLIAASCEDGVELWDLKKGSLLTRCGISVEPHALVVTPDGRSVVTAGQDGSLSIFDAREGTRTRTWQAHESEVNTIAVNSDGRVLVSGSLKDKTIRVWDIETGRRLAMTTLPFGVLALDLKRSLLAIGDRGGNVLFFYDRRLTRTPVVTPVRLWNFGRWSLFLPDVAPEPSSYKRKQLDPSEWADELTVFCDWCGKRSVPPPVVLEAIRGIARNADLEPGDSLCLKLHYEAWDEPRLLSHCSLCREPLKYNPFVVDNREFRSATN